MWGWEGVVTGKAKLLSQLGSDLGGILLVGINQVGNRSAIGLASLIVFLSVMVVLGGPCAHSPCLLGSCSVVESGSLSGVNIPFRGKQALDNRKVTILGGNPQGSALVIPRLVGINSWIRQQEGNHLLMAFLTCNYEGKCLIIHWFVGINSWISQQQ